MLLEASASSLQISVKIFLSMSTHACRSLAEYGGSKLVLEDENPEFDLRFVLIIIGTCAAISSLRFCLEAMYFLVVHVF